MNTHVHFILEGGAMWYILMGLLVYVAGMFFIGLPMGKVNLRLWHPSFYNVGLYSHTPQRDMFWMWLLHPKEACLGRIGKMNDPYLLPDIVPYGPKPEQEALFIGFNMVAWPLLMVRVLCSWVTEILVHSLYFLFQLFRLGIRTGLKLLGWLFLERKR